MRPGLASMLILLAATACSSAADQAADAASSQPASADLVDITSVAASVRLDIRYAGPDNFVGEPVEGYAAPKCLLSSEAAAALDRVQADLAEQRLSLLVFDCFRPQRAVDHFVRWAEDTADLRTKAEYYPGVAKSRLFDEGYIAERSGHSRASTIDLTLATLAEDGTATPIDMGTPFDFFDPLSHTESPDITPDQLTNRLLLRGAMEAGGFRNYPSEWWHYTLRDEPYPDDYFDVPVE